MGHRGLIKLEHFVFRCKLLVFSDLIHVTTGQHLTLTFVEDQLLDRYFNKRNFAFTFGTQHTHLGKL